MKRISFILIGVLLGAVLAGKAIPQQVSRQLKISTGNLVNALRILNTTESMYMQQNGRFADRDQMVAFLRQGGYLSKAPVDFENPKPYELAITTSADGNALPDSTPDTF